MLISSTSTLRTQTQLTTIPVVNLFNSLTTVFVDQLDTRIGAANIFHLKIRELIRLITAHERLDIRIAAQLSPGAIIIDTIRLKRRQQPTTLH